MTEFDGKLEELLRSSTPGFRAGFADRVMERVAAEASTGDVIARTMQRQFTRWAPIGLAASLALAAFNVSSAQEESGLTPIEAVLGLEPVTVVSAYAIAVPGSTGFGEEP